MQTDRHTDRQRERERERETWRDGEGEGERECLQIRGVAFKISETQSARAGNCDAVPMG